MLYSLESKKVQTLGDFWVAESATVVGSVILENDTSVWFNAVIRGDNDTIRLCEGSNIQDGSVLHTDEGHKLIVGKHVTVGHQAMLHSCVIGQESLIGMKATILDDAIVGENCLIGANTLITAGKRIPDRSLVLGSPGRVVRELTEDEIANIKESARHYIKNFKNYKLSLKAQC